MISHLLLIKKQQIGNVFKEYLKNLNRCKQAELVLYASLTQTFVSNCVSVLQGLGNVTKTHIRYSQTVRQPHKRVDRIDLDGSSPSNEAISL